METTPNSTDVSPEELKAEQEALLEAKDEEIRQTVISEYGFDETVDAERIEKAVAREKEHRKVKASLTKQKVTWRERATNKPPASPQPKKDDTQLTAEEIARRTEETVTARFEQRDLDELQLPEELKAEVKALAKAKGISIRAAAADSYIQFKKKEIEDKQRTEEAALSNKPNNAATGKKYSLEHPPTPDMSTEEGRKEWDDYVNWAEKQKTS